MVDFDAGPRLVAPFHDRGCAAAGTLDGDRLLLRAVHLHETTNSEAKIKHTAVRDTKHSNTAVRHAKRQK